MKSVFSALLLAFLACGCADSRGSNVGYADGRPPGRYVLTQRGVRVWAPMWLNGSLLAMTLQEVDYTAPEADPRIVNIPPGVPLHVEILIMEPGAFSAAYSPTGLARGATDMKSWIRVAFRMSPYESTPLLPALPHELRHVRTGDAKAGH